MALALAYFAAVNLAAFAAFGWDKRCAMAGGLGSVLAQQTFRHKTRKQPFANILVAIFASQALLALVLIARQD